MNLISDVRADLDALDSEEASLIKFGRTVGGVFLLFATVVYIYHNVTTTVIVCTALGSVLVLLSMTAPRALRRAYRNWMGAAFVLGWIVSRVILALFFFVIITPVAIAARAAKKKFLDTDFKTGRLSYWIPKTTHSRYDKMS